MLEIASFRRTPRYLKDLLFCPSLKFSKRSLLQRHFDSNVLCRCCACAFVAGRRPDGPRPMAANPAPTALRAAVTGLASIVRNTRLRRPFGHVFLLQHAEAFCNSESHFPGGFEIPRREKLHEERQNGRLPTAVVCISRRPRVKMAQVLAWWLDFSPHCSSDIRTAFVLSRAAPLQRFLE